MIHHQTDYVSIKSDEAAKFISAHWLTAPTSAEFRDGMEQLIAAMRSTQTGRVITDTRNLGALSIEDQTWANTDWLARAVAVGYSQIALVLSSDIFTQMSVEDTMSQVQGLKIGYFDTVEKAREWMAAE